MASCLVQNIKKLHRVMGDSYDATKRNFRKCRSADREIKDGDRVLLQSDKIGRLAVVPGGSFSGRIKATTTTLF